MGALIAEARRRGLARMTLEVDAGNEPALNLYRSLGFRAVGRRKGCGPHPFRGVQAVDPSPVEDFPLAVELGNPARPSFSDWVAGKVFRIYAGRAAVVLEGLKGPADLGYDPDRSMLFLPRMQENLLTAYGWRLEPRELAVPEP